MVEKASVDHVVVEELTRMTVVELQEPQQQIVS
jgi:hypothetical protein